jgi:hypothetical protein
VGKSCLLQLQRCLQHALLLRRQQQSLLHPQQLLQQSRRLLQEMAMQQQQQGQLVRLWMHKILQQKQYQRLQEHLQQSSAAMQSHRLQLHHHNQQQHQHQQWLQLRIRVMLGIKSLCTCPWRLSQAATGLTYPHQQQHWQQHRPQHYSAALRRTQ